MVDFAQLRKQSLSDTDKLSEKLAKLDEKGATREPDTRYWQPTVDQSGNGSAVIRFLPAPPGEDEEFIRFWDHAFKGPGGWYIEKSLTSLGEKDPVGEYNSQLWNSGTKENQQRVRGSGRDNPGTKRNLRFTSGIYVVNDPKNPDNNGKVFLYTYGKKIMDKIALAQNPEFEDDVKLNPFNLWKGANFRMKIRKVDGQRNYDMCVFDSPSALSESDEEIESIWKKAHSLKELMDRKHFKTYDELQKRLAQVIGANQKSAFNDEQEEAVEQKAPREKAKPKKVEEDDDDDNLAFLQKIVDSDDE